MKNFLKKNLKRAAVLTLLGVVTLTALWFLFPLPTQKLAQARAGGALMILDREGGLLAWRVDKRDGWRLPVGLERISPWMIKATLAAEDKRFFAHPGVDPVAAARALTQNAITGRRISGASTITMQNIRMLWPNRRKLSVKLVEMFRALQLERLWSKQEVLELYLNLAPYGGNVVGVQAASLRYFGKPASQLTLGEAALLAGVPQSPARFHPTRHLDRALERRTFVLARMRALGLADERELAAARREPIECEPLRAQVRAPLFAEYIAHNVDPTEFGDGVRTTLDPAAQAAAWEVIDRKGSALRAQGINGAAVVVVDVGTGEVVALVGSSDPNDPLTGKVNGATAYRQPGSLFKPFLYAAAFDIGLLTPQSVVYDVPTRWVGYAPENFDRSFQGPMPAAKALLQSRNLPAVRLLSRIGHERLIRDLRKSGVRVRGEGERYGMTLALGSAETNLLQISEAYATLTRLGRHIPLKVLATRTGREPTTTRVFAPGAAYLTVRSLGGAVDEGGLRPAYKTGTSWNFRDAWAVAMTPRHIVAVWTGRLSGIGHETLVGAKTALPLALDILERVTPLDVRDWKRPGTVARRRVCALSGAVPSVGCTHTIHADYLRGVSSDALCPLHRAGSAEAHWPSDVARAMASMETDEGEQRGDDNTLELRLPAHEGVYVLDPAQPDAGALHFTAQASDPGKKLYWFLNGELVGERRADTSYEWPMRPGQHRLTVSDGQGGSASATFSVIEVGGVGDR